MDRKQFRLGFYGFGEVGRCFAEGLRKEGFATMAAFDIAAFDGPLSRQMQSAAGENCVELVRSPSELAEKADVIIAGVTGTRTVDAAKAIAATLTPRHIYVDLASTLPKIKELVGELIEARGAAVVDGGIMTSPLLDFQGVDLAVSGPGGQQFYDLAAPWGFRLRLLGPKMGAAAILKIIRSVVSKGTEALLHECGVCAVRYGIHDEVFKLVSEMFDNANSNTRDRSEKPPFMDLVNLLLTTAVVHDRRRAEEAEMSAEVLEEAGVEPIMTRATAKRLRAVADLGLAEHFGGAAPGSYLDVLEEESKRLPPFVPVEA